MARRSKLASVLERTTQDPRVRTAAASALVAGGAIAAAKVVREHTVQGRRETDSYRFTSAQTPRDEIGRIAEAQLDLTIDLLKRAPGPDHDGETVHEARKALKRLRALLRVSRGAIADQRYRHENRVFRDVGRALSGTRDAQVLLDTLDGLSSRYAEVVREETWSKLRASLLAATDQSETVGTDQADSLVGVLSDARGRVARWPVERNGDSDSLANGLTYVYRRGRRAYFAARSKPNPETLHELRKRGKDLWHGAQLLEPVGPKQLKQLKQGAHQLSDLLGEDHDLTILREHAQLHTDLVPPVELELLLALIRSRQKDLRREAMACAAELYGEKPKKLRRRVALD